MKLKTGTLVGALALSALILGPLAPVMGEFGATAAFAKNGGDKGGDKGGGGGKGGGHSKSKPEKSRSASTGGKPATKMKPKLAAATPEVEVESVPAPNAHGKLASELKGLNAYHASETAFANASPNSQVGRIATYRDAALATIEAGESLDQALADLTTAEGELAAYDESYTGRSVEEIDADIAALDPDATDYQDQLDALNGERTAAETYETDRTALEDAVTEAETAVTDAETELATAETTEDDALLEASNGRELSEPALDYLREQLGL